MGNEKSAAYPVGLSSVTYSIELRDLIAMQLIPLLYKTLMEGHQNHDIRDLCNLSYGIADQMLVAREETRKQK